MGLTAWAAEQVLNEVRRLRAVADAAHVWAMKGGRPGRAQAVLRALADAGYDVGQEKDK
jgi:hypothetical protein